MVNVPLRQVYVDHDQNIINASSILKILNDDSFDATVICDGGSGSNAVGQRVYEQKKQDQLTVGRSKFHVTGICCASEIPIVKSIIEPLKGVTDVKVITTTKEVFVDHDSSQVSARDICDALNDVSLCFGFLVVMFVDPLRSLIGIIGFAEMPAFVADLRPHVPLFFLWKSHPLRSSRRLDTAIPQLTGGIRSEHQIRSRCCKGLVRSIVVVIIIIRHFQLHAERWIQQQQQCRCGC
jgi:copper chaperone CopZ